MLKKILSMTVLMNRVESILLAFGIFILGTVIIYIFKRFLLARFQKLAEKTESRLDDFVYHLIHNTLVPLFYFFSFYVSSRVLVIPPFLEWLINIVGVFLFTVLVFRLATRLLRIFLEHFWIGREMQESRIRAMRGMINVLIFLIWALGAVFLMDNIGIHVSSMVAGLGIGGIAVALGAQAILGDLFSYFSIFFDRPFEIGDFIIVGDFMGGVEYIGIKTTRLRSLSGEQLIFSNTDLTNSRIRNFKRMQKRRVVFKLGVTYQTPRKKLKDIPDVIKKIIQSKEKVLFDRAHFASYDDSCLTFEVVYNVLSSDYNFYMDIQQGINLDIHQAFEQMNIEFAYPTRTVILSK